MVYYFDVVDGHRCQEGRNPTRVAEDSLFHSFECCYQWLIISVNNRWLFCLPDVMTKVRHNKFHGQGLALTWKPSGLMIFQLNREMATEVFP